MMFMNKPIEYWKDLEAKHKGGIRFPQMGLRDYFAAKAMQGLLHTLDYGELNSCNAWGQLSRSSYEIAKSMLEARDMLND